MVDKQPNKEKHSSDIPKEKKNLKNLKSHKKIINDLKKSGDSNIKVFSISINPIFIIITSIILGLMLFTFFKYQTPKGTEVALVEFLQNLKNNKYSEVVIQNTGKAIASSKYVYVAETIENENIEISEDEDLNIIDFSNSNGGDYEVIDLNSFSEKIANPDLKKMFKSAFLNNGDGMLTEILAGEDFLIGNVQGENEKDLLIKNAGKEDLEASLSQKGKSLFDLYIPIIDLQTASEDMSLEVFKKNGSRDVFSDIWITDAVVIGYLVEDSRFVHNFDWGSLQTDFLKIIQDELAESGMTIEDLNTNIQTEKVDRVDFGMIVQLLSLLFIGFLVISIMKGISGGGKGGIMQFGQSKAKMFFGRKTDITFKNVAGVDSAKEELEEVVLFLKEPKRFHKLGARIPKGLLMVGSPGTGKTLLARAIAGEAGVPFFHTSGSEFEEMLVGAGASRVRDLFSKAKKAAPALIFIDEIDAVARKRGTTVQSSSTEQTLNQILVEMDGFEKNDNVIVIAATNRPDVLDPAILRPGRFDRRIVLELPDINGREAILKIHTMNKPLSKDLDLKKVARRTVGYSGADLENMLNEAAIIVAKDSRKVITFNDIEEAANRVVMGRERKLERTNEEIERTAYHEAGHAIVAKKTPESDPVHRITIVSRGMALGTTMQLPERDKYSQNITELRSRLKVLMAGRAAEELIYGEDKVTSGASNDIEQATKIARRMVKLFGFSEKLGKVKYGESNELQYLGYGYGENRDFSEHTATIIDEEVKRIIDDAYTAAIQILQDNKEILDKVAKDLLEKEVIEGEDFDKYFKN